ncbi:hypothetical protein YC2023_089376 [Brassica napus]
MHNITSESIKPSHSQKRTISVFFLSQPPETPTSTTNSSELVQNVLVVRGGDYGLEIICALNNLDANTAATIIKHAFSDGISDGIDLRNL